MHLAQGFGQLLGRRVLEQVAQHTGVQGATQEARPGESGDDDHLARQRVLTDALRQLQSGQARHLDVGDHNIGPLALHALPGLLAVGRGADHVDVRLELEQGRQCAAHHGLVFGEEDADHGGVGRFGMRPR